MTDNKEFIDSNLRIRSLLFGSYLRRTFVVPCSVIGAVDLYGMGAKKYQSCHGDKVEEKCGSEPACMIIITVVFIIIHFY